MRVLPAPERVGVAVRRPCDRRPVTVTLDVEHACEATLALAWAAQQVVSLPEEWFGAVGIVSMRAFARAVNETSASLLAAIADVVDPDGAQQLELGAIG